jgi:hypothetical protein
MPSAEELRALVGDYSLRLERFVENAVRLAGSEAASGETYLYTDVPQGIFLVDAKKALLEAFPNCKVGQRIFTRIFCISWS